MRRQMLEVGILDDVSYTDDLDCSQAETKHSCASSPHRKNGQIDSKSVVETNLRIGPVQIPEQKNAVYCASRSRRVKVLTTLSSSPASDVTWPSFAVNSYRFHKPGFQTAL